MNITLGRVAAAAGLVYVAVGLTGFLVTGPHAGHAGHLLWFRLNPLHNVAHLALGALLLVGASRGAAAARQAIVAVGLVFLLLGAVGPVIAGTPANLVAVNGPDHLLHLLSALALLASAVVLGRREPQPVP